MTDIAALKNERRALIARLLAMQQQFIALEHEHGVSGRDYWAATEGLLVNYREDYARLAMRVVDLAHQIVGTSRN